MKAHKPLPVPPGPRLAKYDNVHGMAIYSIGLILLLALIVFAGLKLFFPQLFY